MKVMKWNNCYFYAKWRQLRYGDYVLTRRSRHRHKWPFFKKHYLVLPRNVGEQCPYLRGFVPFKDSLGNFPCPLFKGFVKKGDEDKKE